MAVTATASATRLDADIVYGHGTVGVGCAEGERTRPLRLDVHLPADDGTGALRPAVVMAFGGAFHRGSRSDDRFEGNTSIAEYARRFAARGYVCASIDYRLVPEDPRPGDTVAIASPERMPLSRVDLVRRMLGLPPATPETIWRAVEAACDDTARAVRFLAAHATRWRIDPTRIALMGFSAGARNALNAMLAEDVDVAAVVALSGYADPRDIADHAARRAARPPLLLVASDGDLDYIRSGLDGMVAAFRDAGWPCDVRTVPGHGHFYPAEAPTGPSAAAPSVEACVADFLRRAFSSRPAATSPAWETRAAAPPPPAAAP